MLYGGGIAEGLRRGVDRVQSKRRELAELFQRFKEQNPYATVEDYQRFVEAHAGPDYYLRKAVPARDMLERMAAENAKTKRYDEEKRLLQMAGARLEMDDKLRAMIEREMLNTPNDAMLVDSIVGTYLGQDASAEEREAMRQRIAGMDLPGLREQVTGKMIREMLTEASQMEMLEGLNPHEHPEAFEQIFGRFGKMEGIKEPLSNAWRKYREQRAQAWQALQAQRDAQKNREELDNRRKFADVVNRILGPNGEHREALLNPASPAYQETQAFLRHQADLYGISWEEVMHEINMQTNLRDAQIRARGQQAGIAARQSTDEVIATTREEAGRRAAIAAVNRFGKDDPRALWAQDIGTTYRLTGGQLDDLLSALEREGGEFSPDAFARTRGLQGWSDVRSEALRDAEAGARIYQPVTVEIAEKEVSGDLAEVDGELGKKLQQFDAMLDANKSATLIEQNLIGNAREMERTVRQRFDEIKRDLQRYPERPAEGRPGEQVLDDGWVRRKLRDVEAAERAAMLKIQDFNARAQQKVNQLRGTGGF